MKRGKDRAMTKHNRIAIAAMVALSIAACATTKGAVIGGGIGAVAGDAGKGAAIGASAGAVIDIID